MWFSVSVFDSKASKEGVSALNSFDLGTMYQQSVVFSDRQCIPSQLFKILGNRKLKKICSPNGQHDCVSLTSYIRNHTKETKGDHDRCCSLCATWQQCQLKQHGVSWHLPHEIKTKHNCSRQGLQQPLMFILTQLLFIFFSNDYVFYAFCIFFCSFK